MTKPTRGLGRGLDALLGTPGEPRPSAAGGPRERAPLDCPIDRIDPRANQPRRYFDKVRLEELAASLRTHGLIEPLVVRTKGDRYELIAGERRWRAARRAGFERVPIVVREVADDEAFELALIENVQREDLNAVELAEALRVLIDSRGYTQEALAERIGKDRSTIANALRLLKLPDSVREMVVSGALTEGHARALLGAADAVSMAVLADKVVRGKLNVREAEKLIREAKKGTRTSKKGDKSPATRDLELRLARKLGTKCEVRDKNGAGTITVHYGSLDELDRLIETLL